MILAVVVAICGIVFPPSNAALIHAPGWLQAEQTQQGNTPPPNQQAPEKNTPSPPAPNEATPQPPAQQNAPKEQPNAAPPSAQTPQGTQSAERSAKQAATSTAKSNSAKPVKKHKKTKKKAAQPTDGPRKIVVRNGSTADPELEFSPGLSRGEASYQRQTTTQLLAGTEVKLKALSGQKLNANDQALVDQIRNFMDQAKAAVNAGDLQRGHTLAYKAHLLSNELMRR